MSRGDQLVALIMGITVFGGFIVALVIVILQERKRRRK